MVNRKISVDTCAGFACLTQTRASCQINQGVRGTHQTNQVSETLEKVQNHLQSIKESGGPGW